MTTTRSATGAKTLPEKYFTSPDIYARETRSIFRKRWICVGRASDIPHASDYFLHELDSESFIVVRDDLGNVNCLYNVCRHRGTRMCEESCGHFKKRIQCPYHAWTYDLDGSLKAAPNMTDVESFDVKDYSLPSVACVVSQGFILINLDRDCAPFESSYDSILSRFDDWGLEGLVTAHAITYDLDANWKIVFQNYSECYHCSLVHPQLNPVTSVKTASNDFQEGPFLGGPMILSEDYETVAMGGALCGEPLPQLSDEDRSRVYFYTLFPSLFISPHPDYVLTHRIERLGSDSTRIVCEGCDLCEAVNTWGVEVYLF